MTSPRSLATRAALALVLMVGFYALALGISAALLWIPYAEAVYLGRIHPKLAIGCVLGAGAVIWAIVPRPDRFEPPGPQLTRVSAPALFRLIDQIARTTAQAAPVEVYLLNDVNAWVTQRGGIMGVGSRRVMGVGLPLITQLTPAELSAVIAHEFGHYVSGDVGLGPWIYKTRTAIVRAVAATDETWLAAPFRAYAHLFLKTTLAVSREQELVADRTAAQVAGPQAATSALARVAALAPAYSAYLEAEVKPVLRAGFLPSLAAGFDQYVRQPRIARWMEGTASEPAAGAESGEYDTHPSMADRLAALERLPPAAPLVAAPKTESALSQLDRHDRALMRHLLGDETIGRLRPIAWDEAGEAVYARQWRELAEQQASWLGDRTVSGLPSDRAAFVTMGSGLVERREPDVSADDRVARAAHVFTAALGATLLRAGWVLETGPGLPLELVHGSERLEPGAVVSGLAQGTLTGDAWQATCARLGIGEWRLAPNATAAEVAGHGKLVFAAAAPPAAG